MTVKKITCCCGAGLGSSLLVQMNVDSVLKTLGVKGVEVDHMMISLASPSEGTLFVVGQDLAEAAAKLENKIVLANLMDKKELEEKLRPYFEG